MNNNHCLKGIESPRIYTYKITFKDTPYYYYGVHKERIFNEEYLGTPYTNKWCWDLYEAERQILEVFPNTDEGWIDANKVEKRLIRPVFNSDPYCLNENCAGILSLEVIRRNAKKNMEEGKGIFALTKEQKSENAKKTYQEGKGLASITKEQRREIATKTYYSDKGLSVLTEEQRTELGRRNGKNNYAKGIGLASLTKEQLSEIATKTYQEGKGLGALTKEQLSENVKKANSQRWKCLVTGYTSTAPGVSHYQRKRGIDTSKRVRIA